LSVDLVFVAHPDDEALGAGGTIAEYARDGKSIYSIIFSYGEGSDPLLDPEYITKKRIAESKRAANILGNRQAIFLGLRDLKFIEDIKKPIVRHKVRELLKKHKPKRIFTHTIDDAHPAHRAVASLVYKEIKKLGLKTSIYTFNISNPLRLKHRDKPRLYIDISKTFETKKRAIDAFKTQRKYLITYYAPLIYMQNWLAGLKIGCNAAEVFHKW
jgi:LmbE family N-acetylglucosaminyl deacetylase